MFINYRGAVGLALVVMCGVSAAAPKGQPPTGQQPAVQKTAPVPGIMWPFNKGNSWTIPTTINNATTKSKVDRTQVITVADVKKVIDGEDARLEYSVDDKVIQVETYRTTAAGIFRTGGGIDGTSKIDPPLPIIKYPLKVGNTWNWKGIVTMPQGDTEGTAIYTVPEVSTLKLAGEVFKAYKVHLVLTFHQGDQKIDVENDYWFAPNVGLVKQGMVIGPLTIEGSISKYKLVK